MGFQCPTATCCLELFLINFIFEFVFLSDISWVSGVCIRETEPGFIQLPTPLLRCRDHTCLHSGRGPGHRHPGGSHTPCVPSHQARPLATLGYCIRPTNNPMTQRKSEICSVVSSSLQPQGLYCPWNSPGQNTGVGSLSLLQGDLPNAGIEPRSPTLQVDSLPAEPQGKPENTRLGSLPLLQWIFTTQELNRGLLRCRWILYQLSYEASP